MMNRCSTNSADSGEQTFLQLLDPPVDWLQTACACYTQRSAAAAAAGDAVWLYTDQWWCCICIYVNYAASGHLPIIAMYLLHVRLRSTLIFLGWILALLVYLQEKL